MTNTKSKLIRKNGKVYANKKIYSEDAYQNMRIYQDEYERRMYRRFSLKLNRQYDKEIIKWLEQQDNLTDYVRSLVQADLKNQHMNTRLGEDRHA